MSTVAVYCTNFTDLESRTFNRLQKHYFTFHNEGVFHEINKAGLASKRTDFPKINAF